MGVCNIQRFNGSFVLGPRISSVTCIIVENIRGKFWFFDHPLTAWLTSNFGRLYISQSHPTVVVIISSSSHNITLESPICYSRRPFVIFELIKCFELVYSGDFSIRQSNYCSILEFIFTIVSATQVVDQ